MILCLFCILSGFFTSLLLCSPFKFYPPMIFLFTMSVIIILFSRNFIRYKNKKYYVLLIIPFLFSYYICSLVIFNLKPSQLEYNFINTNSKKAIIFYCSGQMDEYTPQYASKLLKSENTLLKPFYAMKLKLIYKKINLYHQNENLLKVASEFKNSLLKNYPYYFYIAYSDYYPDIYNSIQASIKDGCGDITILNYSFNKLKLPNELIVQLNKHKISIKITSPVYTSFHFSEAMIRTIQASAQNQDGILLIDKIDAVSTRIRDSLVAHGYPKQNIIISPKIDASEAIDYFLSKNFKKVFYMNLLNDNYDYKAETTLQSLSKHYTPDIQLSGLRCWGYNKFLVRASIEILRNKQ